MCASICKRVDSKLLNYGLENLPLTHAKALSFSKEQDVQAQFEDLQQHLQSCKLKFDSSSIQAASDADVADQVIPIVNDCLESFIKRKKGFFSFGDGGGKLARSEDAVLQSGIWTNNAVQAAMLSLLERVDPVGNRIWCGSLLPEGAEEAAQHAEKCMFVADECPFEGCSQIMSRRLLALHDTQCPFKPLDCELGCGDVIVRQDMSDHITQHCPLRQVSCPFASLGCSASVTAGTLDDHLQAASVSDHALLIVQAMSTQDDVIQSLQDSLERTRAYVSQCHSALSEKLGDVEKNISTLNKQSSQARDKTKSSISKLNSSMQTLGKTQSKANSSSMKLETRVQALEDFLKRNT